MSLPSKSPEASPPSPDTSGEPRHPVHGRLLVASAAILWSSGGFFMKAPLFEDWPGPVMAFWRALFACVVLVPLVRRPKWSWKLVPMMLLFSAMNFTYLSCMELSEASNAIWLQSTSPVYVLLVGVFVFGERARALDWLLVALGAVGVGVILFHELQREAPLAMIYGLLSGVFYAGVVLSLRQLRDHDAFWLVALNHVAAAVFLSPFAFTSEFWPSDWQWLYLAGFGVFQMGFPYFLFARGLKHIAGHEAAGLGLLEPILVPVWVYLAWHGTPNYQPPQWWTLVGGGFILAGLLLRYVGALRRDKREPL
jgi:DME family drug/metabolite transporter